MINNKSLCQDLGAGGPRKLATALSSPPVAATVSQWSHRIATKSLIPENLGATPNQNPHTVSATSVCLGLVLKPSYGPQLDLTTLAWLSQLCPSLMVTLVALGAPSMTSLLPQCCRFTRGSLLARCGWWGWG